MKTTKQLLGARIKDLRKSKGFSQAEFSEKLEIATNFLSRIEVGVNYPSLDTIERMSEVLEVEIKDLFEFAYLQEGNSEVINIEKLLKDAGEEKRRLAYKIIRSLVR